MPLGSWSDLARAGNGRDLTQTWGRKRLEDTNRSMRSSHAGSYPARHGTQGMVRVGAGHAA